VAAIIRGHCNYYGVNGNLNRTIKKAAVAAAVLAVALSVCAVPALAITREILKRHGARFGVESQPGQGSLFWFTLETRPDET
ncbi:MAG: hypothetical protein ACI4O6_01200, partial [Dysosmobacter sp.]